MIWQDEDRRLLIASSEELEDYLNSAQLLWPLAKSAGMLTPGNLLLSMKRCVKDHCNPELQKAVEVILEILRQRPSAWEKKIIKEIPYRTRLWQNAITECEDEGSIDDSIRSQIRNRVIIEILLSEARVIDPRVKNEIVAADESFKSISKTGAFLWDKSLVDDFPIEKFWFLYLQIGNSTT